MNGGNIGVVLGLVLNFRSFGRWGCGARGRSGYRFSGGALRAGCLRAGLAGLLHLPRLTGLLLPRLTLLHLPRLTWLSLLHLSRLARLHLSRLRLLHLAGLALLRLPGLTLLHLAGLGLLRWLTRLHSRLGLLAWLCPLRLALIAGLGTHGSRTGGPS